MKIVKYKEDDLSNLMMSTISASNIDLNMFRPPINRFMKILDRSFFRKTVPISAAQVLDNRQISRLRTELRHDMLQLERLLVIRPIPTTGRRALLLKPEIKAKGKLASIQQRIKYGGNYMADLYTDHTGLQMLLHGAKHCRIWLTSSMLQ